MTRPYNMKHKIENAPNLSQSLNTILYMNSGDTDIQYRTNYLRYMKYSRFKENLDISYCAYTFIRAITNVARFFSFFVKLLALTYKCKIVIPVINHRAWLSFIDFVML